MSVWLCTGLWQQEVGEKIISQSKKEAGGIVAGIGRIYSRGAAHGRQKDILIKVPVDEKFVPFRFQRRDTITKNKTLRSLTEIQMFFGGVSLSRETK